MKITKIVVTGGPCAGKTTGITKLTGHFEALGYKVLLVHETATELITGGIVPWVGDNADFQAALYYGAMSDKRHGSGVMSENDFLESKIKFGKEMLLGYGQIDSRFLEVLLTAQSLSAAPFGIGGRKVLAEKYGYDQKMLTHKIIKEIGLSEDVVKAFENPDFEILDVCIFDTLNTLPLDNLDVFTDRLAQDVFDIMGGRESKLDETINEMLTPTHERNARIAKQEADMRYVIEVLERDGVPGGGDPLFYLLSTKENHFAKRK